MIKMPKEVPVLEAHHICKGEYVNYNGTKRCLLGWIAYTLRGSNNDETPICYTEIDQSASGRKMEEIITRIIADKFDLQGITNANDDHLTRKESAMVWNEAMKELGYDVDKAK